MNQIIIIVDRNGIREWVKHDKFPETGERKKFNKKIILKSLSQIQRKRKKNPKFNLVAMKSSLYEIWKES